jgi:hypothetical protein
MTLEAAMAQLPAHAFDCVQVNLAVLADHYHGHGTHTELGGPLRFATRPGPLPTVEPTVAQQLDRARTYLGVATEETTQPGEGIRYALADAFDLPWVPYYQHEHMQHSFLVLPDSTVLDAYHNDTAWGRARPQSAKLPSGVPMRVFRTWPVPPAGNRAEVLAENAAHAAQCLPVINDYADAYRSHPDQLFAMTALTLETWLLARSRALHALWRGDTRFAEHAAEWQELAERVYIAVRRLTRGKPAPPGLHERLVELARTDSALGQQEEEWTSSTSKSS